MPISDFWIVLRWWGTLFLIGASAFPVTSVLFSRWHDRGYLFAKAVGLALVTWIVYVLGTSHIAPFTQWTIVSGVIAVFILGIMLNKSSASPKEISWKTVAAEELFMILALFVWSWVKAHEPSIRGLEKFMDYGFMNSLLHSRYFPPADMWYPPDPINYYYFGHLVTATVTKLSGLDLSYTFNLMLATIFALCLTMSFSIGRQLIRGFNGAKEKRLLREIGGGLLTAFLVTLAGNMQTIYAFTQGYSGDKVKPFWELLWSFSSVPDALAKLNTGMQTYWYANATRFIPYTIHEFPSYSFVVSDVHGHVLSIPFVLLAIALLILFWVPRSEIPFRGRNWGTVLFYGFLCGVLLMTNALDGPVYGGLFALLLLVFQPGDWSSGSYWRQWGKTVGLVVAAALITSLPFLAHFKSFVNGLAVDCPPGALANSKIGPILFEGVEKCQKSPFWMMWLLWGFFWFSGTALILRRIGSFHNFKNMKVTWEKKFTQTERLLVVMFLFSVVLIIFPEFFYFKDIYPMHFRSNTMFKLGYQAFIMYSIIAAYTIVDAFTTVRSKFGSKLFLLLLLPQLFLVSIYPYFSVRSYFGELKNYEGIWGLGWLMREYPDNYAAITWLNNQKESPSTSLGTTATGLPVLVEADGDSYTDYDQFSVFTGHPTIIGWAVHEWLWRGSYDVVSPRREEVREVYESPDVAATNQILNFYNVKYIAVGTIERQKFTRLDEKKIAAIAHPVFRQGATVIYAR